MFVRMKFENRYLPEHETEEAFAPFRESFEGFSRLRDLSGVKEQLGISGEKLDFFMDRMGRIEEEFAEHNERYTKTELDLEKLYLDDILKSVDPKIRLDTEQRKVVIDNLTRQTRTIKGEFLRSVQEVQIANFLYLHNIDYEYEKVYEFDILNARKKYTPDFFLRQGEKEVYLEHFGIHEDGTSSFFTEQELEKYKKSVRDKIALHKRYGTKLIYTFSGYTDQRTLLEHLEALLREQGFELNEKDGEEVYRQLVKLESDKYIFRFAIFMETFISRFKTNGYVEKDFDILKKRTNNVRSRLFLDIAREVYREYQDMLIQNRKIDFEDMINLTKRLAEVCRAKIIAVGDDWQSIYAFSGSDITLFTQFIQLMGHGKMLRITKTYRNPRN